MNNKNEKITKNDDKHRKVNKRVRITDKNNLPLANQEIGVHQTDHAFLFGCGAFDFIPYVTEGSESWKQITDRLLEDPDVQAA